MCIEDTFDNYQINMYNQNAFMTAKNFVECDVFPNDVFGIFGLEGTGKTKLLRAMANYLKQKGKKYEYIEGNYLANMIKQARREKDIFLFSIKKKYYRTKIILLDSVENLIQNDEISNDYRRLFRYFMRKKIVFIFSYDCSEKMYSVCNALSEMDVRGKMVGIPKPEQNRNIDGLIKS